jgi:outer membrane beta-barrel protein
MITKQNLILGLALVGAVASSTTAFADGGRRTNGLEKDVAVRHRRLLVKQRLEVTPLFESSIQADYMHTVGGGLKLEYHLSDMLSIGAVGVASASIHTALTDKILNSGLPTTPGSMGRTPTAEEFLDHINTMPFHGAAYASLTPWYGKLAAFSQAYVAFDFYFQAGISFAQLNSNCPTSVCSDTHPGVMDPNTGAPPDLNPNNDPPLNGGFKPGLYLGGGIHVFLNDFLALDLTVRDYAFSDNPSGADFNADLYVGNNPKLGDDSRFIHHLFFGAGLSILLPATVKRTP